MPSAFPLVRRALSSALTLASLVVVGACSSPVGKNATDDRDSASTNKPGGTDVGTPTTSGDVRCTDATATAELEPVYIQIVVDGSGSMQEDGKWKAIVDATTQVIDMVAAKQDRTVGLGMIVFADKKDPTGATDGNYGPYPTSADIPIGYVDAAQASALKERLNTTPSGLTPTQPALEGGYNALRNFKPQAPLQTGGRKVVVLITDGFPFSSIDTNTQVANSVLMAIKESHAADPILTFVMGVGAFPGDGVEYDPVFVGRVAEAGGTKRTPTCNPYENTDVNNVCYFQVTPGAKTADQLREEAFQAINTIRQQTLACEFQIKAPPSGFQLDSHVVTVRQKLPNGSTQVILPNASNGWSFDSADAPTRVFLNGSACSAYRQSGGQVEVILGCK